MPRLNLGQIFSASEAELRSKLSKIRASFSHPGLKGQTVEDLVRQFLADVLPKNLGVGTGVVFDSKGNTSKQIDIVIFDKGKTPSFLTDGQCDLFPCECVFFAIEVKTSLTKSEFAKCESNMDSFKGLDRCCYTFENGPITRSKTLFGKEWRTWPAVYLVWAFETPTFEALLNDFAAHRKSHRKIFEQIDSIFSLEHGFIANIEADFVLDSAGQAQISAAREVTLLPTSASHLVQPLKSGLFDFLTLFSTLYNQADIGAHFNFLPYHSGKIAGGLRILPILRR